MSSTPLTTGSTDVELVAVAVDERQIEVPKGTGLVETAMAAGVEIPVFCYEPRLGPPVGACRMCLCEVSPGPPKLQAACGLGGPGWTSQRHMRHAPTGGPRRGS